MLAGQLDLAPVEKDQKVLILESRVHFIRLCITPICITACGPSTDTVAVFALALQQHHLKPGAGQDGSERRASDAGANNHDVRVARLHRHEKVTRIAGQPT
jgi:hypothetical protein